MFGKLYDLMQRYAKPSARQSSLLEIVLPRRILYYPDMWNICKEWICVIPPILVVYILLVVYIITSLAEPAIYQFSVSQNV